MSEPIPEAIPTSADPRSRRPVKRLRGANNASASATQANEIENLMWDPDRPVEIPTLSSDRKSKIAAPPEIVANVQGSSAGAGSGEFHVYKASRRRENERLRTMDEEARKEEEDTKWENELEEKRRRDEERTKKNREKRNKRKGKKGPGQGEKENTPAAGNEDTDGVAQTTKANVKNPLQIPKRTGQDENGDPASTTAGGAVQEAAENGITIHDDD